MTGTGRVYFKSQTSIFIYQYIDQLIYLSMDERNRQSYTLVLQQTAGRSNWPMYQQRRGDAYRWTRIDRRDVSISNHRHQYSHINRSTDRSINGHTKWTDRHISSTAYSRTYYLTDVSTNTRRCLSKDTNWRIEHVYFKSQTSIFTYLLINRLINWLIYRQIDKIYGGTHQ